MAQNKYIGASTRSKEAPRHVAGRGRYADDMVLPRMLHACILRSPYGHARIGSVNAGEATQLAGVVGLRFVDFLSTYRRSRTESRHQFRLIGCAFGRRGCGRCRVVTLEKRETQ